MPRQPAWKRRLLTALFFAQVFLPSHLHAQRKGYDVLDWGKHTLYWVSSDSPMLKHMLGQPRFNESVDTILSHVAAAEQSVNSALRTNASDPQREYGFAPCTIIHKTHGDSVAQAFGMRGLPDPHEDCVTDVVGPHVHKGRPARFSTDDIFEAFEGLKLMLDREKHFFVDNVLRPWTGARVMVDWSKVSAGLALPFQRARKKCSVAGVGLKRVGAHWYVEISVTNVPSTYAPKFWHRQSVYEFVHVGRGGRDAHALPQRLPTYETDKRDGPPVDNTTTALSRGQGIAMPGAFYPVFQEENPALQAAFAEADVPIRQASDALTPSTMSILFLPLVLNLVPISLITHVGTRVFLAYMLGSDVVTVVPLLIKGIELAIIGSQRFRAVTVRVENQSSGRGGAAAAAQLWTAECRAEIDSRLHGILFVTIAVVAVVVGIWLELWARRFVMRRSRVRAEMRALYLRIGDHETYETYDMRKGEGGAAWDRPNVSRFTPDDCAAHEA